MTTEADTLAAIGCFIRETPGAKTLAEAAAIRGMTIEQVAASIRKRPVAVAEAAERGINEELNDDGQHTPVFCRPCRSPR